MKEIYTEIIIDSSLDKVWEVFSDFSSYTTWNPFIRSLDGDIQVGAKIKVLLSPPDSKEMVFKPKILEFQEKKKIVWLGNLIFPGLFDGKHSFEFVDTGSGIKFIQKESFSGILLPLFSKMLDDNTKRGFVLMNEKLKYICEQ